MRMRAKKFQNFDAKKEIITDALVSHTIYKGKIRPPEGKDSSQKKYQDTWFIKESIPNAFNFNTATEREKAINTAEREVIAQELFRMWIPDHPRTRLAYDDKEDSHPYILSEEVKEYRGLGSISIKKLQENIANGTYTGLGDVVVMAILMNENDLKFGNMGVNDKGKIIKVDGDWCFASLTNQYKNRNYNITSTLIDVLPGIDKDQYFAGNWFDVIQMNSLNPYPQIITPELSTNPLIRAEINNAILRAIVMPEEFLDRFIMAYYVGESGGIAPQAFQYTDALKSRLHQLREAALSNQSFIDHLNTQAAADHLEIHLKNLTAFNNFRQFSVFNPSIQTEIRKNFSSIKEFTIRQREKREYDNIIASNDNSSAEDISNLIEKLKRKGIPESEHESLISILQQAGGHYGFSQLLKKDSTLNNTLELYLLLKESNLHAFNGIYKIAMNNLDDSSIRINLHTAQIFTFISPTETLSEQEAIHIFNQLKTQYNTLKELQMPLNILKAANIRDIQSIKFIIDFPDKNNLEDIARKIVREFGILNEYKNNDPDVKTAILNHISRGSEDRASDICQALILSEKSNDKIKMREEILTQEKDSLKYVEKRLKIEEIQNNPLVMEGINRRGRYNAQEKDISEKDISAWEIIKEMKIENNEDALDLIFYNNLPTDDLKRMKEALAIFDCMQDQSVLISCLEYIRSSNIQTSNLSHHRPSTSATDSNSSFSMDDGYNPYSFEAFLGDNLSLDELNNSSVYASPPSTSTPSDPDPDREKKAETEKQIQIQKRIAIKVLENYIAKLEQTPPAMKTNHSTFFKSNNRVQEKLEAAKDLLTQIEFEGSFLSLKEENFKGDKILLNIFHHGKENWPNNSPHAAFGF